MNNNTNYYINIEKQYYTNGNVQLELPYKQGVLDGTIKQYYDNGNIHNIVPFAMGYPHGLARSYSKEGKISKQVLWYEGKLKNKEPVSL